MIDVFDKLLLNDKLNPNLPIDDLHLNGAGYRILVYTLRVFYVSRDMDILCGSVCAKY